MIRKVPHTISTVKDFGTGFAVGEAAGFAFGSEGVVFSETIGVSRVFSSTTGRPSNSSSSQYSKLAVEGLGESDEGGDCDFGLGSGVGSGGESLVCSGSDWVRGGDRREPR